MDVIKESNILKALGHPVRLRMVEGLLKKQECNVNKMAEKLGLPQSTVSQHLGVLRMNGIIRAEKNGVNTCYRVVSDQAVKIINIFKDR